MNYSWSPGDPGWLYVPDPYEEDYDWWFDYEAETTSMIEMMMDVDSPDDYD